MPKPTGIIVYEGPSMLDGAPIVAIATLNSTNRKTGNMVQIWIMRADIGPKEASYAKLDSSVCGDCPHRRSTGGSCYVELWQAPSGIFRKYQRGEYPHNDGTLQQLFKGRAVRFGAYGDPAAVPYAYFKNIATLAARTTGYTHQIGHRNFDRRVLEYCMVSADTPEQALADGPRTFRVKAPGQPIFSHEVYCPADSRDDVQCASCGLCKSALGTGKSVVIDVHGSYKKRYIQHTMEA